MTALRTAFVLLFLSQFLCISSQAQGSGAWSPTVPAGYPRAVSKAPTTWTRAVATVDLRRGDTLRASDIRWADTLVTTRLPLGADTIVPAEGWLIRRAIAAGEWLRPPAVIPRQIVTAGSIVTALWRDDDVQLLLSATALNSASAGAPVTIRVGGTRRLNAVAVGVDTVRIK